MNYPVWELTTAGGGLLIALMAVVHVYVAHFAVGGGLYLVLLQRKAYAERSPEMLAYLKRHARFFLLLTMVFGGITGVGIWFTIALLNPAATTTLIHTFVFGWATEWVCFVGEIVALFIYTHTFGKMRPARHLTIGWLYFIFAWLSLFLINGIIDFMLTPGNWLQDGSFWSGFFNPSMWPALAFRTAIACMFAGIFGFLTSVFIGDTDLRQRMARYCARWILLAFVAAVLGAGWYFATLPNAIQAMIRGRAPELAPYLQVFMLAAALVLGAGLVIGFRIPRPLQKTLAFTLLAAGLVYMGGFEFLREGGRRPFVIYDYMYANAIPLADVARINQDGLLKSARWVRHRELNTESRLAAGRELFRLQCLACHSVGGPMNDILPLTAKFSIFGMDSMLDGLGKINAYMPHFVGTRAERTALANHIVTDLQGNGKDPAPAPPTRITHQVPAFDPATDEYVLLAWNNLGMHCVSDSDPYWVLLPPANDLFAQLIQRGDTPRVVTQGITLTYQVEPGHENPSKHVEFWKYAKSLFGTELAPNIGLSGNGMSGEMHLKEGRKAFEATLIPVVPYPDTGGYNPYPTFTIEAYDNQTGKLLARTRTVAPTSTEMGCKNCHGGQWRVDGKAGFSDATAADILAVHDKNTGTRLLAMAREGKPQLCQSCHSDPVLGAKGQPGILNFPAAMHGWHANYLTERGTEACFKCHPSAPTGPTRCLRGTHAAKMDCTHCHGTLEDHALSLLKGEKIAGKPGAERLMRYLKPRKVKTLSQINPRTPWLNEPDCLNCHVNYQRPDPATADAFNRWTSGPEELYRLRHDETRSMMCESCHGSTHAVYPAINSLDRDRDNIQPMQYQGNTRTIGRENCQLCHTQPPTRAGHHPMASMVDVQAAGGN